MAPSDSKPALKLETGQFSSQEMPPPPTTTTATPSTEKPRPILKLSTSRQSSFSADTGTPSAEKKIKIKVNSSQPNTPAPSVPTITKTKAGRASKPTEKIIEAKKRSYESDDDDENAPMINRKVHTIKMKNPPAAGSRKPFLLPTPTGKVFLKPKGEKIPHVPGEAYDSEASDRETDLVRESAVILRTLPGPATEYLNKALEEGRIGQPKPPNGNGADLSVEWLDAKDRRAMVTVDGRHYAAVLVDLPTIIEAMKTWDRKNFLKNMDITQMLLCFAEVKNEQDARYIALPPMVQNSEYKWPHGLTPPMHDAVNRRFRKQPSEKQLVSAAAQVKRLLAEDALAIEPPTYEFIQDEEDGFYESGEEDAEGEEELDDYFGNQAAGQPVDEEVDDMDIDLEAELEAEFAGGDFETEMMEGETPGTQLEAQTPMTLEAATPAAAGGDISEEDEEEEEEISDEDEDDDDDDELDEDEAARQAQAREMKKELFGIRKKVADLEQQHASATNAIMRNRLQLNIQNLKKEIELRKAQLNITDDE
ncbi:uncharacterized protein JN550_010292 [Neoarthrinium moseri]|uniref:uncharacterized protein n=1 Tax=Neoarthrinium moseri TaxID=1658444 RepID=UPI001FDD79E4|nr:uncharacterized protein JN550_010292 [Neoarthrinium moseri]KAI1862285.1 hypothetical protein JN550_010292 [Neoarthrinium moseri]